MTTWLITHPACLEHDTGPNHPESIARLQTVLSALEGPVFQFMQRQEAPQATIEQLARVHDRSYVERMLASLPAEDHAMLDNDTVVSPGSGEAALRAAGAVCLAVDAVMAGEAQRAFCAVRPPGHHAEPDKAMGFCLFNNVAVGAAHARALYGLKRIAIVDFDVHHGNGTAQMFAGRKGYFYLSSHQQPLFPHTGDPSENRPGNIYNLALPPYTNGMDFRPMFQDELLRRLDDFAPNLIFVSAGFDGHIDDPLANLRLNERDFGWVTEEIVNIARRHCQGRVISTLEGGYNLNALRRSVITHVTALL
ncbi:MAG TPA: histone deacetylase family protein [Gammaproteobacteria bacterium]|nr:histone deacetylase family protein [Gammaproteobacteria bacterium]